MNLPNKLTMFRIFMIPLFIACFYLPSEWVIGVYRGVGMQWNYFIAAIVFLIAYVTDTLDGRIARAKGLVTDFGKLMDPTADKLLTSAALILLCRFEVMSFGNFLMPVFAFIIIAREIFVSGIRQLAASKGTVIAAKPIGKAKTTLQFIALFVTLLAGPLFKAISVPVDFALMVAATLLTIWSGVDYTLGAKELFSER